MPDQVEFLDVAEDEKARHYYHRLERFEGSFAMLSLYPNVQRAIVFVHGFGGDSHGTWAQFQLLVDELDSARTEFAEIDLYFFQYHSVWERVVSSANRLQKFLAILIPTIDLTHFTFDLGPVTAPEPDQAEQVSQLVVPFPGTRAYDRVTLVGHSEGGVVLRTMILEQLTNQALLNCRLALFAPAIAGYKPAGLLGAISNFPGFSLLLEAVLVASPAYQDLKDKVDLDRLRSKTEAVHDKGHAFCADILWGRNDHVVKPQKYDCDEQDFEPCNHTQICKPSEQYLKPIDHVKKWPW
jgi:pimeloyl-ACP methyl ester carboxylesterase